MTEKKVIRLSGGQKPKPIPPRLTIRQGNRTAPTKLPEPTPVSSPASPVPIITLGRNTDTSSPITVNTQQLCSGTYMLGVQGVGKSSLLEQVACQLLELDESLIVFDPHGQLIDNIIKRMPARRLRDTFHLDLKDRQYPFALNVFACSDPDDEEERDRTRNQVTHAFEKLWPETQRGVYFKKLLRHVIILLIENPGLTLADVPKLLRDGEYRDRYVRQLKNLGSQDFWEYNYGGLSPTRQHTESSPLLSRVDELLAEPVLKRVLCQPRSTVNLRSLIDRRQNLFVTLPINEEAYSTSAVLIGTMLMSLVYAATFSYADVPEDNRPGFSLIVDEFQNFATEDYAKLFAQGRKFKVKQFLAHQYRGQLNDSASDANRDATLSAGTKIIFRVTEPDSRALGSLFIDLEERQQPVNLAIDILDKLERHPNPVVKEFAVQYVWPLKAGAKDRIGQKRWWHYHGINDTRAATASGEELSYEKWRWYMLNYADSLHAYARTEANKRRLLQIVDHPQEGRDYLMVPDYPVRDFGAGTVQFDPKWADEALELLNKLLYNVQKTRMHYRDIDPKETLSPVQSEHYAQNVHDVIMLEVILNPLLRLDIYRDAEREVVGDQVKIQQLTEKIRRRDPWQLAASFDRIHKFHRDIELLTDALIAQPITQGGSEVRPSDVAQSLQHLPLRQAFVRIGTDGHVMETLPLSRGVEEDEEERRRSLIRRQTRETLCRHIESVDAARDESPAEGPAPSYEPEEVFEEPVAPTAPVIRRARPLSDA